MSRECNADYDHRCDAGGEDEHGDMQPCSDCLREEKASMADAWASRHWAPPDPVEYRESMVDAGRGHLVRDR